MKVGITGGIGSGKTTVCQLFERLGVPVYYADDRAKWLMQHDPQLVQGVRELLGDAAYLADGRPNRAYIASIIFNDKEKLAAMNALVHPAVWKDGNEWHEAQKTPYTLKEAALLYETKGYQLMDKMIVVYAAPEICIQRVMARDKVSREQVLARMNQQMPSLVKAKKADFVIMNDGKHSIIQQSWKVHHQLLDMIAV